MKSRYERDEEFIITLRELVDNESHNLDLFNLEVAKFRLKYGMSASLVHLYAKMGRLGNYLIDLENKVNTAEGQWSRVITLFQSIKEKEESKC